jgi:hypothetical protein
MHVFVAPFSCFFVALFHVFAAPFLHLFCNLFHVFVATFSMDDPHGKNALHPHKLQLQVVCNRLPPA